MNNFSKTEKIIFSLATCAVVIFSYFLFDDSLLFPKTDTRDLKTVGSFVISKNDVRRKNIDTFSWLPAGRSSEVFHNDSIFTGASSEAEIQLADGTRLYIEPNSLVSLNFVNGQMTLDLKYGDLQAEIASASQLVVKTAGEETKLEGTDNKESSKVRVKKSFSGLNVKLEKGQAAITSRGQRKNLDSDSGLKVSAGAIQTVKKPQLTILTEDGKTWLKPIPTQPIPVAWEGKGSISGYEVELAADADFADLIANHKTKETQWSLAATENEQTYYWRVKVYDSNGGLSTTSPPQRFNVRLFKTPVLVTPENASVTQMELKAIPKQPLRTSMKISWQAMPELTSFQVQVAPDANFQNITFDKTIENTNELLSSALMSGIWHVRVKGFAEKYNYASEWSAPHTFELRLSPQKVPRPPAPVLAKKTIEFTPTSDSDRDPASPQAPVLEWKPLSQTKGFRLQISKDKNFADSNYIETTENSFAWEQFQKGTTYYRVFAVAPNGLISMPSEIGEVVVGFRNPELSPLRSFNLRGTSPTDPAPAQALDVKWTSVPTASAYRLEMSPSSEFSNPITTDVSATQSKFVLQSPGVFHFRVVALDSTGQPLTDYSAPQKVEYQWKNPLGVPNLREPFDRASIFLQKEVEAFIWLEWRKVDGAQSYSIEVSTTPDFNKTFIKNTTVSNRFLIKEKIPQGKLYWRVRANAVKETENSEWTAAREFTVHSQKNESFVQ